MSTLVSILLAVVMNTLSGGNIEKESKDISKIEIHHCKEDSLQTFDSYYIIKNEQLFHKK